MAKVQYTHLVETTLGPALFIQNIARLCDCMYVTMYAVFNKTMPGKFIFSYTVICLCSGLLLSSVFTGTHAHRMNTHDKN